MGGLDSESVSAPGNPSASLSCVRHRPELIKHCHGECGVEMRTVVLRFLTNV